MTSLATVPLTTRHDLERIAAATGIELEVLDGDGGGTTLRLTHDQLTALADAIEQGDDEMRRELRSWEDHECPSDRFDEGEADGFRQGIDAARDAIDALERTPR